MKSLKAKIGVNNRKIHEAESNRKSVDEIRSHYKAEIEVIHSLYFVKVIFILNSFLLKTFFVH